MIHLYALSRAVPRAAPRGIEGVPLEPIAVADLVALVTRHLAPVRASADVALAHVAAIEAAAEDVDVLPVRLGRGHTDPAALRARVEASLPELRAALERVGGRVEFVVRPAAAALHGPGGAELPDVSEASGPGTAYLERLRARHQAAADAQASLREQLADRTGPLAAAATAVHDTSGRRGPERCFLVARADAPSFGRRARQLAAADDRFVVGGPWPPFTFAALTDDAEVVG